MNKEELYQRHLDFAVGDAKIWFRNIPRLTHRFVMQRFVDSITNQFRGHEILLYQFHLSQLNGTTYEVRVNETAYLKVYLGREVEDE